MGDVAFVRVDHDWKTWIGRTQTVWDWVTPSRVAAWHATLDHEPKPVNQGDLVAAGFHWTLAPHVARESELGPDGHARRDARSFLPPVPLPRRLWAGSRVTFHQPLRVGDRVERSSVIASIDDKQGRESRLVFVTVRHRYSGSDGVAIDEEQDLVYRDPPPTGSAGEPRPSAAGIETAWQRTIHPTETLLFRYSALTLNTHRIHYDRRYAMQVEGYAGLVVHGPLIATLLLDLVQSHVPAKPIARFSFKALRPTFDTGDFAVWGASADTDGHYRLWSTDNQGARAVEAEAWT